MRILIATFFVEDDCFEIMIAPNSSTPDRFRHIIFSGQESPFAHEAK
jgi:hypothetical protein